MHIVPCIVHQPELYRKLFSNRNGEKDGKSFQIYSPPSLSFFFVLIVIQQIKILFLMHKIQIPYFSSADHRYKIFYPISDSKRSFRQRPLKKIWRVAIVQIGRQGNYFAFVAGTSAAEEWVNLRLAAGQGPAAAADIAAIRGQAANYPGQILQFQMSTQSQRGPIFR